MDILAWANDHDRLAGALAAAIATAVVNLIFVLWVERVRAIKTRKLQVEIAELSAKHAKELRDHEAEHAKKLKEYEVKAKLEHDLEIERVKHRYEADREKLRERVKTLELDRAERYELLRLLRESLHRVSSVFRTATDPVANATAEQVIENAKEAFGEYAKLRDLVARLEGRIKHSHYLKLQDLKKLLVNICLDLALDPNDRGNPARLARLEEYRAELLRFDSDARKILLRANVFSPPQGAARRNAQHAEGSV